MKRRRDPSRVFYDTVILPQLVDFSLKCLCFTKEVATEVCHLLQSPLQPHTRIRTERFVAMVKVIRDCELHKD